MNGFYPDRLERVAAAAERHIADDKLSGVVVLLSRYGELSYLKSFGLMSRESGERMRTDSLFRIYSMTKPITAVAALILLERGYFQLIDPISRYLPGAAKLKVFNEETNSLDDLNREVTFHDLFTHTSGLTYHFGEYGKVEEMYREKDLSHDSSLSAFISQLFELPLAFQPGEMFRYSFSCDVLAYLVELMSGTRYADFIRQEIFEPLGMADTSFYVPQGKIGRFASMYGAANILEHDITGTKLWEKAMGGANTLLAGPEDSLESRPSDSDRGGHGLVSTAEDYWKFCHMLLSGGILEGNRVLSPKVVEIMTRNHLLPSQLPIILGPEPLWGIGFGLGVDVTCDVGLTQSIGSDGTYSWGGAATTSFWIDPVEQFIGVVMAQFQPANFHPVSADVHTAAYQALEV